ncbi:hypothetical protein BGX31_007784 [Mortierella sp. GBA43]|nr:hypothetical protein BGX31_007784 [Mortierella sp. GBA43]
MNYRLGYLAYFASRELAHEFNSDPVNKMHGRTHDQDPAFGNWGLLDHKLAFEWIRDHIAAFGGDPSRVTSITTHMLTPSYHGLFSRDITHSGATGLTYASYAEHQHQDMFDHLCDVFWVDETRQKPENHGGLDYNSVELLHRAQALRDIPAEQLMQASELPENEMLMAKKPLYYDPGVKSVIIGSTRDEGSLFAATLGACSVRRWQSFLDLWIDPSLHHEVDALYGTPQTDNEARNLSTKMVGDLYMYYPTYSVCERMLALDDQDRTVYRYHSNRALKALEGQGMVGCRSGNIHDGLAMDARTIDFWRRNEQWAAARKEPSWPLDLIDEQILEDTLFYARL